MKICQSCGLDMKHENLQGKNKDSSLNEEYCIYCYPKGEFNKPLKSFDEMVEICVPYVMQDGLTEVEARTHLQNTLKDLKRWR